MHIVVGFVLLVFLNVSLACVCPAQDIHDLLSPQLADGFDFPLGGADGSGGYTDQATGKKHRGWRGDVSQVDGLYLQALQTWQGSGGGSSEVGQRVHAIAAGFVLEVMPDQIWLEHRFVENGQMQSVRAGYAGVHGSELKPGDIVKRRQPVARIAPGLNGEPPQFTLTLRHQLYSEVVTWPQGVSDFICNHRRLFVPAKEGRILIAVKHRYQLHVCEKGQITHSMPIALGQDGRQRKMAEGDNRTPVGDYLITQKALGPFEGDYGAYLGAAWLRLNYPNAYDARTAFREGRISKQEHAAIVTAASRGALAPIGTPLGGGIGIHGWISDWPDGENQLTWGCLSLRQADLLKLHSLVKKGTRVLILP